MGWIRCVGCEKLQHDFVAQTIAFIAPFQYVLQQVSCSYETIPNAPKYYETDRNISLGSNGVDWVRSLRKIPTWLRGRNFYINCTSSPRFAPSFMQLRNDPKCIQTLWNTPKHEFRVQWGGSGAFVAKNTMWLRGTNFCINWTSLVCSETSFMQLRNGPKCTQILQNTPKHEFRVQWGGSGAFVGKNYILTSWHELLH
jgi:hypothetical protein